MIILQNDQATFQFQAPYALASFGGTNLKEHLPTEVLYNDTYLQEDALMILASRYQKPALLNKALRLYLNLHDKEKLHWSQVNLLIYDGFDILGEVHYWDTIDQYLDYVQVTLIGPEATEEKQAACQEVLQAKQSLPHRLSTLGRIIQRPAALVKDGRVLMQVRR